MTNLPVVTGPNWPGLQCFTTTRLGGVGMAPYDTFNLGTHVDDEVWAVKQNRALLRKALPAEPIWLNQTHSTVAISVDNLLFSVVPPDADASVTTKVGQVLAVLTADCLPIVMVDTQAQVLGVVHAGWRGLVNGVVDNTYQLMQQKGATQIQAWVGPAIGPLAFEVGAEVKEAFVALDPDYHHHFKPHPQNADKYLADLPSIALMRLIMLGAEQVINAARCTYSEPDQFFSYRRTAQTGRIVTIAWLT